MIINEGFYINNIDNFETISVSTNKVYRFQQENDKYVLKVNNISSANLSPFWRGIKMVFASDFDIQRENIEDTLLRLINPHIKTAQLIFKSDTYRFQLFREAEGLSFKPDEFPNNYNIEYQLGQFIGFIHSKKYDYFGNQKIHFHAGFKEKMLSAMLETMNRYWSDSKEVKDYYTKISCFNIAPDSFSIIMTDISANQFIFNENMTSINAVIDFDGYVFGPREWELSVLEMCLQDGKAFKKGYEEYSVFPEISEYRDFYRFFMFLCEIWEKPALNSFMNRNLLF